ncbi:hypothetical protein V5O48_018423 [Marasmius crinis-equi]|uniref:Uncharacterized protein n=1 Tax=Marasmius crinis-equi TaxID=585013 RepID=A0ABR3EL96_9AGAR
MSKRGSTSKSDFLSNASGANVTGATHNHIGQDSHSTTTNHYTHCNNTYNDCTINFNDNNPTTSVPEKDTMNDSDKPNETVERPRQNGASAVWAVLGLCVLTGGRWTFDIIRHVVRRQLFARLNRDGFPELGLDGAVAEAIRVEVENIEVEPRSIGNAAGDREIHEG